MAWDVRDGAGAPPSLTNSIAKYTGLTILLISLGMARKLYVHPGYLLIKL